MAANYSQSDFIKGMNYPGSVTEFIFSLGIAGSTAQKQMNEMRNQFDDERAYVHALIRRAIQYCQIIQLQREEEEKLVRHCLNRKEELALAKEALLLRQEEKRQIEAIRKEYATDTRQPEIVKSELETRISKVEEEIKILDKEVEIAKETLDKQSTIFSEAAARVDVRRKDALYEVQKQLDPQVFKEIKEGLDQSTEVERMFDITNGLYNARDANIIDIMRAHLPLKPGTPFNLATLAKRIKQVEPYTNNRLASIDADAKFIDKARLEWEAKNAFKTNYQQKSVQRYKKQAERNELKKTLAATDEKLFRPNI